MCDTLNCSVHNFLQGAMGPYDTEVSDGGLLPLLETFSSDPSMWEELNERRAAAQTIVDGDRDHVLQIHFYDQPGPSFGSAKSWKKEVIERWSQEVSAGLLQLGILDRKLPVNRDGTDSVWRMGFVLVPNWQTLTTTH